MYNIRIFLHVYLNIILKQLTFALAQFASEDEGSFVLISRIRMSQCRSTLTPLAVRSIMANYGREPLERFPVQKSTVWLPTNDVLSA